ncbi:hypothetical protein [Microbacterium sp. P04]|uniref:hypothetical protein n=1 Tax=Microbacterium sp. P04 TaxID=3366947 RepID=UPI0037470368
MTDANLNDDRAEQPTPHEVAAPATSPAEAPADGTDSFGDVQAPATATQGTPPQYGIGPFSVREVILGGVWLVAFIVSFFPINLLAQPEATLIGGTNVWVSGLSWVLTIGLPTVAVFLIALRRLSPTGIRRFGSLGIDQFASVAFAVSAIVWLQLVWETVAVSLEVGVWVRSWVIWVELVLMLAGVVLTVFAPFIPGLEQDFQDRPEEPAHRNARPVRAVVARPKTERPRPVPAPAATDTSSVPAPYGAPYDAAAAPVATETGAHEAAPAAAPVTAAEPQPTTGDTGSYDTDIFAPLGATGSVDQWAPTDDTVRTTAMPTQDDPDPEPAPAPQAFWALVPVERDIVDDYGRPLFRIGPTAWALVIEDRGQAFVVRHEDGRVGFLHDTSGVTRG